MCNTGVSLKNLQQDFSVVVSDLVFGKSAKRNFPKIRRGILMIVFSVVCINLSNISDNESNLWASFAKNYVISLLNSTTSLVW